MTDERPPRRAVHAAHPDRVLRSHETLPHTADVGLRAVGPELPGLFEEAALAVAEIAADRAPTAARTTSGSEDIELAGGDLAGLAFAWLNELIGLADIHGPLASAEVRAIERTGDTGWRLTGRATFDAGAEPRLDVKSATYHGLVVEPIGGGWQLVAYLDV